ncbi:MAG: efflux RND transporter permease subunit, partial [Spirochaetota bacterium]
MSILSSWYKRPVTGLTILLMILSLSTVSVVNVRLGPSGDQGRVSFSVIIQHYGIDPEEIERSITKPLEDAVSVISGIEEIRSTSEYGKSRVDITLSDNKKATEIYLRLRDEVDRVYNRLPKSVQKPQILSGSLSRRPVFITSFSSKSLSGNEL